MTAHLPKLVDRRTMHRQAAHELPEVETLRICRCNRKHRTHLEFVYCAFPGAIPLSQTSAQFAVLQFCGERPEFSLYRLFSEASRAYDTENVWGCFASSGCRGLHEIRLVVV